MNIEVYPSYMHGKVNATPSKSEAHRLIILSCVLGRKATIYNIGNSKDVLATLSCLKEMGAKFSVKNGNLKVLSFKKKPLATLNCFDSASTLRFLLPVCSALGIKATFTGSKQLLSRPIKPLIDTLNSHGANIKNLTVNGKIDCGKYIIDGSISSEYVSGLMLALSLLKGKSVIKTNGKKVSVNYIKLTASVLKIFGVKTTRLFNRIYINAKNIFSPKKLKVNGDYSSASYMFLLGALNGDITVNGLKKNSYQGDKRIIHLLKKYGAKVKIKKDSVRVYTFKKKTLRVNLQNNPDLAQTVAVLGANAFGKTVLKNISRLKHKESDRVKAICAMLKTANIGYKLSKEKLIIYGGKITGGVYKTEKDHRTVMSSTVLATCGEGKSVICDAESVNKSYPEFFNHLVKLGGKNKCQNISVKNLK